MAKQMLKINSWLVPKLKSYKVEVNKIWSSDSGRDLAGSNKGTLIGIFPKVKVKVGSFTPEEMQQFQNLVNRAELTVNFFDPQYNAMSKGVSYYINDYEVEVKRATKTIKYADFDFNLIPNDPRR